MSFASGAITATATTNGASTTRALNASGVINSLQIIATTLTGGTPVTFSVYDNNVASSATLATGATWSGKSPGYSGQGPGTAAIKSQNLQSARTGDQAGQTAPTTGIAVYWQLTAGTGNIDYTAAPVVVASIATPVAVGNDSFSYIDNTSATGNVVAAVTAARLLYQVVLAAGQSATWTPSLNTAVSFGIDIVTAGASVTAIAGSYNLDYTPLP